MLACVFVAAVVIAVVIATNSSNEVSHFRTVAGNDVQSAINSARSIVNQYTK